MHRDRYISVIIPNHNGSATIGRCLNAVFSSAYENFEVIVVDDCSTDDSLEIIQQFPCRLIRLHEHSGAAAARNAGARLSKGELLFFTDSDCLPLENTLAMVNKSVAKHADGNTILGGTYTEVPPDATFFCMFQSIFVNYFETKRKEPDYIATHALAMDAAQFKGCGGFKEQFLPIIEDVEFSHRLRRKGWRLVMDSEIRVEHLFNFSLVKSLRNAFKKSKYWTIYSVSNGDLFEDSGTASIELKINGAAYLLSVAAATLSLALSSPALLLAIIAVQTINLLVNRGLLKAFYRIGRLHFALLATAYYISLYPAAVLAGAIAGISRPSTIAPVGYHYTGDGRQAANGKGTP